MPHISTEPLVHQRDHLDFIQNNDKAVIAWEMGLGKTWLIFKRYSMLASGSRVLYIGPKSVIDQVQCEYQVHIEPDTDHSSFQYIGPHRNTRGNLRRVQNATFVITTYDMLRNEYKNYLREPSADHPLFGLTWDALFFDEGHIVRNHKTIGHQAAVFLRSEVRYAVTGTPIYNRPKDLNNIFSVIGKKYSSDLVSVLKKADVDIELSPFKAEFHRLEMKTDQQLYYNRVRKQAFDLISEWVAGDSAIKFSNVLAKITRLKQAAIDKYCRSTSKEEEDEEDEMEVSNKMQKALDLVEGAYAVGEKVIIFTQYNKALHIMKKVLEDNGYNPQIINGSTPRGTISNIINEFEDVLIVNILCASTGLNIIQANHVVFLDLWWNAPAHEQAIARSWRYGQTRQVHVHYLISVDTIEDWIYQLQRDKTTEAHEVIKQSFHMPGFSRESVQDLLQHHLRPRKPKLTEEQIPDECPVCLESASEKKFEAYHYNSLHPHPLCKECLVHILKDRKPCPICREKP